MKQAILFLLLLVALPAAAQRRPDTTRQKLYLLQDGIVKGDQKSLITIAGYLDDTSFVQEFLGYHNYPNTARGLTMRILMENCRFTKDEYKFDSTSNTASFLSFLKKQRVVFDDLTGTFLITPMDRRETTYQLKWLSDYDIARVNKEAIQSPYPDWYYENQIDGFLVNKDPQALLWIAAAWFQKRSKFNIYYFKEEEFTNLIKRLTHIEVGVPDERGKITFLYNDDYYAVAKLNFLIYWAKHYMDYEWNTEKGFFENKKELPIAKSKEEVLFPCLLSDNDSLAMDAFVELTELDTGVIKRMAKEYNRNSTDMNKTLPIFACRFIPQIAILTQYSRDNGFTYKASGWLKDSLAKLKEKLSFRERYRLENNLISRLTLEEITAVEYFGLIYEREWDASYSIGRVLDKFYSRKLAELADDPKQLKLFLKKAKLFDGLGIIGNCNKYLRKFENCSLAMIDKIKLLHAICNDPVIRDQCQKAISFNAGYTSYKPQPVKLWEGSNLQYGVNDLQQKYRALFVTYRKTDNRENAVEKLISQISYAQLGGAIKLLQKDTALNEYNRFHFIESDFGFDIKAYDSMAIDEFLSKYTRLTEYQLYEHYLKETGMNCFDSSGGFYYPGVYDILKYDVVDAFTGGGGGRRENGVYLVIKLLELHFNTTLGFPKKKCNWQGMYSCDCTDRAFAWMYYLQEKGLITIDKTEPVSISSNN